MIVLNFVIILQALHAKAKEPFTNKSQHIGPPVGSNSTKLSFFPSLEKCRERGKFQMDKKRTAGRCNKEYVGHPSLLPGIFTIFCQHGKVPL